MYVCIYGCTYEYMFEYLYVCMYVCMYDNMYRVWFAQTPPDRFEDRYIVHIKCPHVGANLCIYEIQIIHIM